MRRSFPSLLSIALVGAMAFVGLVPGASSVQAAEVGTTQKVSRVDIAADGTKTIIDERTVGLSISQTTNLRGRQAINVTWEGAHPTGGTVADPNSSAGRTQEYPFVLLQCRGVDTSESAPQGQEKLSPETCWTQTSSERYLADSADGVPAWRSDLYATEQDRAAHVGAPSPRPAACPQNPNKWPLAERWLPFRGADETVYYGGPPTTGCVNSPPETDDVEGGGLPSNTTYGITRANGKGSAQFAVWTKSENASLGCSADVKCALVAVPIVGISCDAFGTVLPEASRLSGEKAETADATCRAPDRYESGETHGVASPNLATAGALWWSESNWRNRITVPLEFAVTGDVCAVVNKEKPQALFGSPVLNELMASWQPAFCTDTKLFSFSHVQSAESASRALLGSGAIDVSLGTAPPDGGFARPTVRAPLTVGGFAVTFSIDDADWQRVESLRLNARLVAKLLSESYPALPFIRTAYPALADNPLSIAADAEFQALNPGLPEGSVPESAATLQMLSSDSDLMWSLTSWLNADPEARAWLNGTADPWGMKVNPNYRDISLPVESWPLSDNWPLNDDAALADFRSISHCYDKSPTPYLPLIANPTANLATIVQNVQFGVSAARTKCAAEGTGESDLAELALKQQGRQPVGSRFVLGIASLSAAERYSLRTAALQTSTTVAVGTKFENAEGRTFVAPDDMSLKAGAALLEPDAGTSSWVVDYAAFSTPSGSPAYPGVMPLYADIPTTGLSVETATKLVKLLCYSATQGQTRGTENGKLPAGYLPLTAANGLGSQRDYVFNAVTAVRAQAGTVPAVDTAPVAKEALACTPKEAAKPAATKTPKAPTRKPAAQALPEVAPDVVAEMPVAAAPVATEETLESARTVGQHSGWGSVGLPVLVLAGFVSLVGGALLQWGAVLRTVAEEAVVVARRRWGG